jgi:hypothetical protein
MSRRYWVMFGIRVHGQHNMSTYPERTPLTPPAWEPPARSSLLLTPRPPHERVLCSSHFLGRLGRAVKEVHETAGGGQWGTLARGPAGGSGRGGEVTRIARGRLGPAQVPRGARVADGGEEGPHDGRGLGDKMPR